MKKFISLALSAFVLLCSCKKENDNLKNGIFKGPEKQVYQGKAWTWIQTGPSGNPAKLAITLTDAVLISVLLDDDGGAGGSHDHEASWALQLHTKEGVTTFK